MSIDQDDPVRSPRERAITRAYKEGLISLKEAGEQLRELASIDAEQEPVVGMKTCGACHIEKPLSAFCSRGDGSARLCSKCKPCMVIATREWRAANPSKSKAARKAEYAAKVARRALAVAAVQRELEFAPAERRQSVREGAA